MMAEKNKLSLREHLEDARQQVSSSPRGHTSSPRGHVRASLAQVPDSRLAAAHGAHVRASLAQGEDKHWAEPGHLGLSVTVLFISLL